jgi:stringent starvation protein B
MISNRPYLLRAFHQWIIDSSCTPILVINARHPRCKIPQDYAEGGEIVFNISPMAVRDLTITNELIEFKASFSGVIHIISAPIKSILSIYAEENGEGLFFDSEEEDGSETGNGHYNMDVTSDVVHLKEVEDLGVHPISSDQLTNKDVTKSKPVLKLVE